MVESDQDKGAEGPKDEGVRQAGKRPLTDDFGLEEHFPDKVPDALADGEEVKAWVLFRLKDFVEDFAETAPEAAPRGDGQPGEEQLLKEREVLRLSQGCGEQRHRRSTSRYMIESGAGARSEARLPVCQPKSSSNISPS